MFDLPQLAFLGGLPAAVSNGVALLSRRTQAPVILGFPHCRRSGRYDFYGPAPMRPAADETDAAFTQRIVNGLVHTIRRHPSQWMLMYRRWAEIPPDAPAAGYPFYARRVRVRHSPFPGARASGKMEAVTGGTP